MRSHLVTIRVEPFDVVCWWGIGATCYSA